VLAGVSPGPAGGVDSGVANGGERAAAAAGMACPDFAFSDGVTVPSPRVAQQGLVAVFSSPVRAVSSLVMAAVLLAHAI
jgi:hypothetical protein